MINYFSYQQQASTVTPSSDGLYSFAPIGFIESPFKDKYGVPRQPALAKAAKGKIIFKKDPDLNTALKTIEAFSHCWVIFVFHEHGGKNWKPSIRPPRLGGRTKVGVLSSRSPHRPNPIGLSVVKIEAVDLSGPDGAVLSISGIDLLDGTPVLDIKPYIPYADRVMDATSGWAADPVSTYEVLYSAEASSFLAAIKDTHPELQDLIQGVLELDPRPAYQKRNDPIEAPESQGLRYGIEIGGFEVKYRIYQQRLEVEQIFLPQDE